MEKGKCKVYHLIISYLYLGKLAESHFVQSDNLFLYCQNILSDKFLCLFEGHTRDNLHQIELNIVRHIQYFHWLQLSYLILLWLDNKKDLTVLFLEDFARVLLDYFRSHSFQFYGVHSTADLPKFIQEFTESSIQFRIPDFRISHSFLSF